jgi:hypothetical protein
MTYNKPCLWWIRFRHCRDSEDDRDVVRSALWVTADTMQSRFVEPFVPATFCLCWLSATRGTAADWVDGGGLWNEPSPGSISSAASASDTRSEPTSTKLSYCWAAF